MTPLHLAASRGHVGVVKQLCAAAGAAVDAQDTDGDSPLILATKGGHEGVVRALLAHGARRDARDERGGTVLHFAASRATLLLSTWQRCG